MGVFEAGRNKDTKKVIEELEKMDHNYNALRCDLMLYLEGLMLQGFSEVAKDSERLETASYEELLELAEEYEFDIANYPKPDVSKLWIKETKSNFI